MSTAAEPFRGLGDGGEHLVLIGHVAGHADGVVPLGDDGGGALVGVVLADVHADQVGALAGQFLGDAAHDVGAGAGHQRRFAFEFQTSTSTAWE